MEEKEYLMLREEINKIYDIIEKTRNLLYVGVAAIFTCSFSLENSVLFLAAYFVIIPCYLVTVDYQTGMWRIGTYLAVFHEGESKNFNWERRTFVFHNKMKNKYVGSYNSPYILASFFSSFLYIVLSDQKSYFWLFISIVALIIFNIYIYKQGNPQKIKETFIEKWKMIKNDPDFWPY